jgi:hypothetical protein
MRRLDVFWVGRGLNTGGLEYSMKSRTLNEHPQGYSIAMSNNEALSVFPVNLHTARGHCQVP